MTPFQQFRLWVRRAPTGERLTAGMGAALAVTVVAWLLAPPTAYTSNAQNGGYGATSNPGSLAAGGSNGQATGANGAVGVASAGGPAGAANAGGTAGGASTGGVSAGGPAGGASAGGTAGGAGTAGSGAAVGKGGCVSPPGSDQGVSANQIKIAVMLFDLQGPAGNSAFNVPTPQQQQDAFQTVITSINATGGIACRHLAAVYFTANEIDQSDLEQKCLDVVQAGVFFAIDNGAYGSSPLANCFPQHHIPFYDGLLLPKAQLAQFYPYMFSLTTAETLYRNTIFALNQRGFFNAANGFKKLGYIYIDCKPQLSGEFESWLNQVGVPSSKIVTYDFGCPSGFSSPSQIEQAVLTFEEQGVTNVTQTEAPVTWSNFTTIAEQQGYHPKYGLPDDALQLSSYGAEHPDYTNANGTISITDYRFGEEHTPGYAPSAGTQKCNQIGAAQGKPPIYQQELGMLGVACDELWQFAAMADHAPALHRTALAAGLQASQSIDFSFPFGPATFSGPGVTYGGNYWRTVELFADCQCWRVIDPTFHPSF